MSSLCSKASVMTNWPVDLSVVSWLVLTVSAPVSFSASTNRSSGPAYPLSSTPAASSVSSGGGKMRREKTTTRPSSKRPAEDEVRAWLQDS